MDPSSPYQPPGVGQPLKKRAGLKPPVWYWYVTYCIVFTLIYLACAVGSAFAVAFASELAQETDEDVRAIQFQFIVMLVICVPLIFLFAAAPFLPKAKWAWIYGFVPICIGLTSCCSLPFSVPLLIFWLKPETKEFFQAG